MSKDKPLGSIFFGGGLNSYVNKIKYFISTLKLNILINNMHDCDKENGV